MHNSGNVADYDNKLINEDFWAVMSVAGVGSAEFFQKVYNTPELEFVR